jgi:hypothetical protein
MAMDLLSMERQLRDTLANLILRVTPDASESSSQLSEVLADGLTRYLMYARRPLGREKEDFELLIDSLEFWASMHGFPKRKPVQTTNGLATRSFSASAGR